MFTVVGLSLAIGGDVMLIETTMARVKKLEDADFTKKIPQSVPGMKITDMTSDSMFPWNIVALSKFRV